MGRSSGEGGRGALEVLRCAMQIKRDGHAFYSAAAAATKDCAAVKMFLALARDEMDHLGRLEQVWCARAKSEQRTAVQRNDSGTPQVFPALSGAISRTRFEAQDWKALRLGMQAERDSITFFQTARNESIDPTSEALYAHLVREDEGHLATLTAKREALEAEGAVSTTESSDRIKG
jgi:rubrerythrin